MRTVLLRVVYPLVFMVAILVMTPAGHAQFKPGVSNNVRQLGHFDEYGRYSNLWGYVDDAGREYALIGHNEGTSILDITEPANPLEVAMVPGPGRDFPPIWREIKTYSHYAYVVSEHREPNNLSGIQIIDLSDLPNSATLVRRYLWPGVDSTSARAHTVSTDMDGFLYIQGGTAALGEGFPDPGGIRIFSLANPVNPAPVSTFPDRYVHDSRVVNNIMFAHNIREPGGRFDVVDVSDRSAPRLVTSVIYPDGGLSHDGWPTEDLNYYITTDEVVGLTMKVWDISVLWDNDPSNDDNIERVGEYIGAANEIAHEARVRGEFVFLSHYQLGLKVLDLSDPRTPVEVGYFDSFPDDSFPQAQGLFNGNWGVYPYLPSGNIVITDIQTGVHVLQFDEVHGGSLAGQVTDELSGLAIADLDLAFIEADKRLKTDENGSYTFASNAGEHTVVLSKAGYFSDTTTVTIEAGASTRLDLSLFPNLAALELSVAELNLELPEGAQDSVSFVVRNSGGRGSLLHYALDDINGPQLSLTMQDRLRPRRLPRLKRVQLPASGNVPAAEFNAFAADTLISDPPGDLLEGTGGDVVAILTDVSDTSIAFQFVFAHDVDLDSTIAGLALDTDFDIATGAFPGLFGALEEQNAMGSEFDVLIDVPGLFLTEPGAALFVGNNDIDAALLVALIPMTVVGEVLTIEVPLEILGDANMAVAGLAGHFDSQGEATSVDFLPDVGHGTLGVNPKGDLSWLELSRTAGCLQQNQADTIVARINTAQLSGPTATGVISFQSNDLARPMVQIPVSVTLVTDVRATPPVSARFILHRNFPNPFNPETTIRYQLSRSENVRLEVFNLLGQRVRTLVQAPEQAGEHTVVWNGRDDNGRAVGSGAYIYRISAGKFKASQRMLLLR